MAWSTGVLLFTVLFYAAIVYAVVQLIKYLIRYGIDYYFKKLEETQQKNGGNSL